SEGKGWTLESDADEAAPDALEVEERGGGVRERIANRPEAHGPMAQGPKCYQDPDSDEMELMASYRVRTRFPEDVQKEASLLPSDPSEDDWGARVDLRDRVVFTIDGEDAKDYDDAIGVRELSDGGLEVGVHIADVSHYVRPGSLLDEEALARATSVYLPDQVVPMLPEELSNGLCSVVEGRPRLVFSVLMSFDSSGERTCTEIHKSVIQSRRRCTYRGVQELLDGDETAESQSLKEIEGDLRLLAAWARQQQGRREREGAMRISSTERKFVFDRDGEVEAIVDAPRYFTMALVEETALAANQAVGDRFVELGVPTIYRVHPEKDPEEIAAVAKVLSEHGLRIPDKDRLTGRDISRLIREARRKKNADALIGRIMGLVERASYAVHDKDDEAEHFGLAKRRYLHFTSPIRRYPDLIVHRWLERVGQDLEGAREELSAEALLQDMNDTAEHCSVRSEMADMASRAVGDLKTCQFLDPRVGDVFPSKVIRVSPGGLEVHLTEVNVRGFLPRRALGDRIKVKGSTLQATAGRRNLSFSEGQAIKVKLREVDFLRLQLMLELA
ncbi:MAG: RNB domain-containing ribonuclease, partial [Planctomycetes bacterium]|nr:RNB domain-containing ribonuclease [Planctomycetota bacterium]